MRIGIVEDEQVMRDAMKAVCIEHGRHEVIWEVATGSEAMANASAQLPDLLLLDIGLPDTDGLILLQRLRERRLNCRVLVVSCHDNPFVNYRVEQACVDGFFDKRTQKIRSLREVIATIEAHHKSFSDSYISTRLQRIRDSASFEKILTDTQMLVLQMVTALHGDAEIASALGVSEKTVESHRTSIMRKLEVHSRLDLISIARHMGFDCWFEDPIPNRAPKREPLASDPL